jgi:hypothetical protein
MDIERIRKFVEPLANKAVLLRGRVLAMVTEENIREVYWSLGANDEERDTNLRLVAEAIRRIGRAAREEEQEPEWR